MLLGEEAGGLIEPFVGLHRNVGGELADQRLNLGRSREVGQFHEGGQARGGILVGHDASTEEEFLGGLTRAERADGIAA